MDFFTHCYDQGYTGLFRSEPGTNALRGNGHSFFRREGLGEAETFFRYLKKNLSASSADQRKRIRRSWSHVQVVFKFGIVHYIIL